MIQLSSIDWAKVALSVLIISTVIAANEQALAQSTNRAAIVISAGDGTSESRCVAFENETISGLDLIKASGFETQFDVKGFGSAVCRINDVGCPADDCFCECGGLGECVYWSYWHMEGSGWKYAVAGASTHRVRHGDVDGWTWGPGSITSAIEPPTATFGEICSTSSEVITIPGSAEEPQPPSSELLLVPVLAVIVIGYGLIRHRRSGEHNE